MQISLWLIPIVSLVSLIAGAAASIVGFGIGSLLTHLTAYRFGTDVAIRAIALPHLAGGLLRGWRLRRSIDWNVLVRFGILSALGGLIGERMLLGLSRERFRRIVSMAVGLLGIWFIFR